MPRGLAPALAAIFLALIAAGSSVRTSALQDQSKKLPEYVVKAGFLYNFAKYVEWPVDAFEKAETPISIGVVGADPFGQELDKTLKDKIAQDRTFVIHRFRDVASLQRCHILFIPRTEKARVAEILKKLEEWPTLTVGEEEGFAKAGGAVNILIDKERPRLEVNTDAAEKAKLTISAKLLKLATIVKPEK
ncbi:MAG TPA: YfiR family protein [Planctomycetota bacterium]|nr:YfiR family protein [Planctomycetota bacterium]